MLKRLEVVNRTRRVDGPGGPSYFFRGLRPAVCSLQSLFRPALLECVTLQLRYLADAAAG